MAELHHLEQTVHRLILEVFRGRPGIRKKEYFRSAANLITNALLTDPFFRGQFRELLLREEVPVLSAPKERYCVEHGRWVESAVDTCYEGAVSNEPCDIRVLVCVDETEELAKLISGMRTKIETLTAALEYIASAEGCAICQHDWERNPGICSRHQYPPAVARAELDNLDATGGGA